PCSSCPSTLPKRRPPMSPSLPCIGPPRSFDPAMPSSTASQPAFPGRQVISLSGDGGLAMLMGDLLTTVQEKLLIKVAVFNNGALQFVELEQKVEGLLDTYTDLNNPNFARVAEAIGLWARRIEEPA